MKVCFTLYMILAGLTTLFGQDTIRVNLDVRDTTYFDWYVQIKGTSYQFQNQSDSTYLELEPNVEWTLYKRNQSESYPQYRFKPNMPDGIYQIYQESLLVEVVQFKKHKRVGKSL